MMHPLRILLIFLILPAAALSTTIYVPDDYPTIQQAIDAAKDQDLILVKPGTYVENIDFKGKTITVKSTSGSQATVIDGNQSGSVATFSGGEGEECVLEGFTLTNGSGTFLNPNNQYGGGVLCNAFSSATILNNIINFSTANFGGAIYCRYASPVIEGNVLSDNSAIDRGGVLFCISSSPVIRDNDITGNGGSLGLLYFEQDSFAEITGNTFKNNNCSHEACIMAHSASSIIIEDNLFFGNNAAGISCSEVQTLTIHGNTIQENQGGIILEYCEAIVTNNVVSENEWIGIWCSETVPLIEGNIIINNQGDWDGGGLYTHRCSGIIRNNTISNNVAEIGGGIKNMNDDSSLITNNVITNNSTHSMGGGIACLDGGETVISDNIIKANSADSIGGGLYLECMPTTYLTNNIISKNKAYSSVSNYWGGGGICTMSIDELYITNCTFTGNIAPVNGGGICIDSHAIVTVTNTILWNNDALVGPEVWIGSTKYPTTLNISYSDLRGGLGSVHVEPGCSFILGPGMIDADPMFVDSQKSDYHLRYPSPCRDAGDNTALNLPTEDFEGDPRIAWNGTVDMGADEFYTHFYWTGNATPGGNVALKFVGLPSTTPVHWWLGSGVLDPPKPTTYGDWYLQLPLLAQMGLGSIPAPDGVLVLPLTLPLAMPTPFYLPLQAGIGAELTNLCVLEVK